MAATSFQGNTAGGGRAGETTSAGAGTGGGSQEGLHIIGRERLSDWGAGGGLGGRTKGGCIRMVQSGAGVVARVWGFNTLAVQRLGRIANVVWYVLYFSCCVFSGDDTVCNFCGGLQVRSLFFIFRVCCCRRLGGKHYSSVRSTTWYTQVLSSLVVLAAW